MVWAKCGDLLQEHVEVIWNSIGGNVKSGFGGAIGGCIVKECGQGIIDEAHSAANKKFGSGDVPVGKFVYTGPGISKNHKFVLHCVCPAFSDKNSEKILQQLILEIFEFCDSHKVESISIPPMGSGVLQFPVDKCAKAFFDGIMEFLEKVNNMTNIKKMNIIVYEKAKADEFREAWDQCFKNKYGDDDSEEEESGKEDSDDAIEKIMDKGIKNKPGAKPKPSKKKLDTSSDEEEVKVISKPKPSIKSKIPPLPLFDYVMFLM